MSAVIASQRSGSGCALKALLSFCSSQPVAAASLLLILLFLGASIFARQLAPFDPLDVDYGSILTPPDAVHWFGTDAFGRDILSRLIHGARSALTIGIISAVLGCSLGAIIGIFSAYFGGRFDAILQRALELLLAFPLVVLALVIVAILGRHPIYGVDVTLILAIAIPMIAPVSRVLRAAALSVRKQPFVDAAITAGYSHGRIVFRHMMPNLVAPYLVMLSSYIAQAILLESTLSFLGLGIAEPTPSWGLMLSGNAADFFETAPWLIIFPGAAISLAVIAFNLFGDGLRDWLDPRFQQ
ncbi:ABC transporter permease [Mesorhizobium australicum]|uniref:Peptide/nickel transport system permease protein n=1 Tax=Mesorhizobium australicum TaxID=536018 RepID=A0A1X7PQY8_9HYPH|nr:ABC transporter permease [Mesorhizobium australicum]SMH54233.1 peptide/nickel transport system permease protein [Mesorhizobium australicum]